MTTKLKWRLKNLPTVDEIVTLLIQKLITKKEAREMLFSAEHEQDNQSTSAPNMKLATYT